MSPTHNTFAPLIPARFCCPHIRCAESSGHFQCSRLGLPPRQHQQRRLEHPTAAELQWERNNHVMIYEGMKDREVEHALDNHFNRVQAMMFVKTVITDDKGNPRKDPKSGKAVKEDDGCD